METITQAATSSLKMGGNTKPDNPTSDYNSKPYLGKPYPSQLVPGVDGSLDPALTCWYCKDTSHLKENCVKLTQQLALDNQEPSNGGTRKINNNNTKNSQPLKKEN